MIRKRTLILAATAAAAVAGPAMADTKSYHGASCFASTGGTRSEIGLTATAASQALCPLVRDRTGSASNVTSAYVEVFNADATALSCTFNTQREDMTSTVAATVYSFSTLSSAAATGNLQVGPIKSTTVAGNESSYLVECTLGAGDIVYHVYVNETGTD